MRAVVTRIKPARAYRQNQLSVKGDVVKSRITGQLLIDLLTGTLSEKSRSSSFLMKELLFLLKERAKSQNADVKNLPADATRLGKELNHITQNLPSLGFSMTKKSTNKGTLVTFTLLQESTLEAFSVGEERQKSFSNSWNVDSLVDLLKPSDEQEDE